MTWAANWLIFVVINKRDKANSMKHKIRFSIMTVGLVVILGGCASVKNMKISNFDFVKFPEFKEEAENIGGYPKVSELPAQPEGVRSAGQWDIAAKKLLDARDSLTPPTDGTPAKSEAQIEREIQALRDKVDAYKLDDPQ